MEWVKRLSCPSEMFVRVRARFLRTTKAQEKFFKAGPFVKTPAVVPLASLSKLRQLPRIVFSCLLLILRHMGKYFPLPSVKKFLKPMEKFLSPEGECTAIFVA